MLQRPAIGLACILFAYIAAPAATSADEFCHAQPTPECLLTLAHEATRLIDDPVQRSAALSRIAVVDARAGFPDQSRASLDEARYLADSAGLEDTVSLRQSPTRMSEEELRLWLYGQIVAAQVKSGWPPENIDETIRANGSEGEWLQMYFAAAEALAETGQTEDARLLLTAVLRSANGQSDADFVALAHVGIAQLLVRMGDYEQAIETLESSPIAVDPMLYFGTIIQIYNEQLRKKDWEGAITTVALAAQKVAEQPEGPERELAQGMLSQLKPPVPDKPVTSVARVQPTASCRANLSPSGFAVAEAKLGFFESALDTAVALAEAPERDDTLWRIADQQIERSLPEDALVTSRLIGDEHTRILLVDGIVRAQAATGNADGVSTAALEILDIDRREKLLRRLVATLAQAGNAAGAARIARDLSSPAIRATAYAEVAQAMLDTAAEDAGESRVKGLAQERGIVILE